VIRLVTHDSEMIRQKVFGNVIHNLYLYDIERLISTLQAYVTNCKNGVWKHELKEDKKYRT